MIEVIEVHSEEELTEEVVAAIEKALTDLMVGRYIDQLIIDEED